MARARLRASCDVGGRWSTRSAGSVQVLGHLPVLDAPHVEPDGRVLFGLVLRLLDSRTNTRITRSPSAEDRNERRILLGSIGFGFTNFVGGHERVASRGDERVVLIQFSDMYFGQLDMDGLEDLAQKSYTDGFLAASLGSGDASSAS